MCACVVDDGESVVYPANGKSWIVAVEVSNNELEEPDATAWEENPSQEGPEPCCTNILVSIKANHMECFRGYAQHTHSPYVLGFAAYWGRLLMMQEMVAGGDRMDERVTRCMCI